MRAHRSSYPVKRRTRSIAKKVALVFLAAGAVWIVVTDILVYQLVSNPVRIARLETAKGWLFVALSAAFIYWIVDRAVRTLARSDATLSATLDSIADGVLILRMDRTIGSANPAAARLLGVEHPDELIGMGADEFTRRFHVSYPDGRLVEPDQLISQRALRGEAPPPYKAIMYPPGRDELVAICTAARVRPIAGEEVELVVSVIHDVTETEHLDQLREQFVSAAAHALRTPVSIVKAYLHLLATSDKLELRRTAATAIDRQCGKIVRLVENLSVLARIRSDSLRFHPEPVACAELVAEVAQEMKGASADHGLVDRVDAQPVIFGDRERLGLVIKNLIEIAYRTSRPRTDVVVRLDERDTRARIGVNFEVLAESERFEHEEGAGYTGLGLERHVVESVVEATRGTVRTEQDEQHRRTEWVEFPTMMEGIHA